MADFTMGLGGANAAKVGLVLAGVAEVPNFYSGMLPSLWTIGHFSSGDASERDEAQYWIMRGLVLSGGLTLATGIGISLLAQTPAPLIGMTAMGAVLTFFYLHALRAGGQRTGATSWGQQSQRAY